MRSRSYISGDFPGVVRGPGGVPRTRPHQEAAVLQTGVSPKNRCVRSDDVVVLRRRHDVSALARSSTSQLPRSQYVAAVEHRLYPVDRKMRLTSARGFVMAVPGFSRVAGTIARFQGQS